MSCAACLYATASFCCCCFRMFYLFILKGKSMLMLLTSLVSPNFLWPILRFAVSNEFRDPCRSWLIAFPQSLSGMLCLRSTWHPGMKAISIKRTTTPMSLSVYYMESHTSAAIHKLTLLLPVSVNVTHSQNQVQDMVVVLSPVHQSALVACTGLSWLPSIC